MTRRRPKGARLLAIGLALLGTWLCAGPIHGVADMRGAVLATLSGFWYAAFLIWMHRLTPGIAGVVSGAYIITGAALTFSLASLIQGGGLLVPHGAGEWVSILGIVLSATVFGRPGHSRFSMPRGLGYNTRSLLITFHMPGWRG